MRGGRAFTKPLPFDLGTNASDDYSYLAPDLAALQSVGMKWCRCDIPWNYSAGSTTGFEEVAGTYLAATATKYATARTTIESYGFTPLWIVGVNNTPGLSATWTSGIPCTPAQFASAMAWIVAQPGLQGCYWELLNEPDGESWGISATLLAQAHNQAYAAMKAADPTCTVVGLALESFAPAGNTNGTDYYNAYVTAAKGISASFPAGFYDIASFHIYFPNAGNTANDASPDAYGGNTYPGWLLIANMQALRVSSGDTTPMWITEFGWENSNSGVMTPQLQAQFYQDFLVALTGYDPVNKAAYSSYLKAAIQYAADNSGAYWGIRGGSDDSSIAAPILTELVNGH